MRYKPVPAKHFVEFHDSFHGDTPQTFQVCAKCGGACEFNKIGTLMPGEREYMAAEVGVSVAEFTERFLDILVMEDDMELDVLRLINGCPFLDPGTFECNCRRFKVVLCEIYPIAFQVQEDRVHFEIDDWCPLSDTLRFRQHFLKVGVGAVSKLPVPVGWYQHVARYDDLHFDYHALQAYRRDRSKPQTFTIEELFGFQRVGLENDPKERFHPYPLEIVEYHAPAELGSSPESRFEDGRLNGRS
jgi:Fe-S-cluster containining protein